MLQSIFDYLRRTRLSVDPILVGVPVATPVNVSVDPILVGVPVTPGKSILELSTVCIHAGESNPALIEKVGKLNHLLIHTKYDFLSGVPPVKYIKKLQEELDNTPEWCLEEKLESMYFNQLKEIFSHCESIGYSRENALEVSMNYDKLITERMCKLIAENAPVDSPLEQFSIIPLIPMKIGDLYFSFTNSSLFMLLTLSLVLLLIYFVTKKGGGNLVPNAWQSLVELIYDFVLNLVNEQIGGLSGNVKQKFFPCILVIFTFLLFCNLQGMIPYSFTVTSHFLITLGLSFSLFIGITIVGFQRNGLHFLSFLLPAGVPLPLAPFLVLLELISYCFRALSLGIRLFANMMAGHSLVKILSGFAWTMLCMNDILYFIGDLGPLFIVLALTGLELGVAILQAYVFTILICIYLNDAINLH